MIDSVEGHCHVEESSGGGGGGGKGEELVSNLTLYCIWKDYSYSHSQMGLQPCSVQKQVIICKEGKGLCMPMPLYCIII